MTDVHKSLYSEKCVEIKENFCILKDKDGKPSCKLTFDQARKLGLIN